MNKDHFPNRVASFPPNAVLTGRSYHRFMDEISRFGDNSLATGLEILMPGQWELIKKNSQELHALN